MNLDTYKNSLKQLSRRLNNPKMILKDRVIIEEQVVHLNITYINEATKTNELDKPEINALRDATCNLIDNIITIYTRLNRPLQVYLFTKLRKEISTPIRIIK